MIPDRFPMDDKANAARAAAVPYFIHRADRPQMTRFTISSTRAASCVGALLILLSCSSDPASPASQITVAIAAGANQTATVASMVATPPAVIVRNPAGEPMSGTQVVFTITQGGGATSDTMVTTNSSGIAATNWYLGPESGATNGLRATSNGVSINFTATANAGTAGIAYFGASQYIEYIAGDLPIIISAPHGGTLVPASIPDRTTGETVRDTNTEELARAIGTAFFNRLGKRPHLIICRLRRTKLDANREIVEAAQGNREAQRAWFEWHAYINAAKSRASTDFPRGLYMDLHGHGHDIDRLELGYLLSGSQLQQSNAALDNGVLHASTSIYTLVLSSGKTLSQLLRGPQSLGTLFEQEGVPAVPSSGQPDPGGADYFSGGYNTDRHGSRGGGVISGFQLESHFPGVRDNATNRAAFAENVVDVFLTYFSAHFGFVLQ